MLVRRKSPGMRDGVKFKNAIYRSLCSSHPCRGPMKSSVPPRVEAVWKLM